MEGDVGKAEQDFKRADFTGDGENFTHHVSEICPLRLAVTHLNSVTRIMPVNH